MQMTTELTPERKLRKSRVGVVTSNKMDKTITVAVVRKLKHPKYGKFLKKTKKFHAHDEKNEYKVGDLVEITETRPMSREKHFEVSRKISNKKRLRLMMDVIAL